MDEEEEVLSGRRARRRWLMVLGTLPFLAAVGGGVWFLLSKQQHAENKALVEQVTGAAFGCVASVRGDAPELWGLERALEHMSRMERITRDTEDPTVREERVRFAELAADAARGCEELGRLMMEAHEESVDLYFAVPAPLAHPPDLDHPERWFRRTLPQTRPDVLELTRQIRAMADAINARRSEFELMRQELPIEGRDPGQLARIIELAPVPRDRENPSTEVWPMPDRIVVLRRASIPRVPCDMRYINRTSCLNEFVQTVSWDGEVSEPRGLERPTRVLYWSSFHPTPDGSLYAVGVDGRTRGIVGRYTADADRPELTAIDAPIDATARIIAVAGGVAVFPSDGSAWLAPRDDPMHFETVEITGDPLVVGTSHGGSLRGIELAENGRLSVVGSEEGGWTSRLSIPGEEDDVLLRMIDSHSRVREIADLRAMRSGRAVALLLRFHDSPDAIAITSSFGRSWLAAEDEGE